MYPHVLIGCGQGNGTRMEGKHDANLTPSFCESRVVPVIGVHVGLIRALLRVGYNARVQYRRLQLTLVYFKTIQILQILFVSIPNSRKNP